MKCCFIAKYTRWYIPIKFLTYSFTPCCTVLQKLTGSELLNKFPAFYGSWRLTRPRNLFLSWARSIQPMLPHPSSWRTILILFSHQRLGLPGGLFPSGFLTKTVYMPFLSPIRATCPAHLILYLSTRTTFGEQYRSLSSSLCSFLHSPVTLSLLGPNILLSTLQTPSAYVSPSMWVTQFHTHTKQQTKL